MVPLVLYRDHLVAGSLGEPGEVLHRGRVVGEHLEDLSDLQCVHGLACLKQWLGAE